MLQRYNFFTYFKIYINKKIHKKTPARLPLNATLLKS